jgi:hypothetical protein
VAQDYYGVEFTAEGGKGYYIVVEGEFIDEPTIAYDLSVVCAPVNKENNDGGGCKDGFDNDGDALIDCDDPDCEMECWGLNECIPQQVIDCDTTLLPGSTGDAGYTDIIDKVECFGAPDQLGNEYTYTFVAPANMDVNFTLSDESWYGSVTVLDGTWHKTTKCDPSQCDEFQYYSTVASVKKGTTYYVMVDSPDPGAIDYKLSVVCDPPFVETACGDNIDNDGDYLIDCADPDCGC